MDNPMFLQPNRDNNSMESLSFHWEVHLNDDRIIKQFDSEGRENLFQEVKDNFDKLVYFILFHKDKDMAYIVDLKNGVILSEWQDTIDEDFTKEVKKNIRLIFFRRHRVSINFRGEETRQIRYFLGFQYLDQDNKNQRIIVQIDSEGNLVIGG